LHGWTSIQMTDAASRVVRSALWVAATLITVSACAQVEGDGGDWAPRVVARYPHDPRAFTQGLVVQDGFLYEGTGQYGESSLRQVDLETGRVERLVPLNRLYFGEGITIFGDRIYQLTWQNGIGLVYALDTLEPVATFRYTGEGWGLTHDGSALILSDGTANLRFLNPDNLSVTRTLSVQSDGRPLVRLNELEYVAGEIWANIWYDDRIARISPDSGEVLGFIDLSSIYPRDQRGSEDVLNGIAYDSDTARIYVTGKNWPQVFALEVPELRR
jgi:glutamine cyclotransferase